MILERLTVGTLNTNCYVVGCPETLEAIVIDPGAESKEEAQLILREASNQNLKVKYIVNTHGHLDHTAGNGAVKEKTGAPILIHEEDAPMLTNARGPIGLWGFHGSSPPADRVLHDGDTVQVGSLTFRVLHTPGHSPGSICLLGDDVAFTGDTLWAGTIGRADLPGSSPKDMKLSLREKLMTLSDHVRIYPGHGPSSTIGEEKRYNPFLQGLSGRKLF